MSDLVYSMSVSLDGFIAAPGGDIEWTAPTEELHRFHNAQTLELGGHLLGRRLYEDMLVWERPEQFFGPDPGETVLEFAAIWQRLPKVVFSTTLTGVEGSTRLATRGVAEEVEELRARAGGKDVGVGGAGLAAACAERDLIDEYRLFVRPVILGAGTPYFPALANRLELELVETRTFGDRVVYLRYRRTRGG
jgi:dihydrofolate reductase